MTTRVAVLKTYKLYIDGGFVRSESGRSLIVSDGAGATVAHLCLASRKDLRDAVEAARRGYEKWSAATAYNRGQVLYRLAEMMEGKAEELAAALLITGVPAKGKRGAARADAVREVERSIDRMVYYAGWADKYSQVLGCNNPVSGPYYNFTITQPTGVVACVAPNCCPLLGLISVLAPVIVSGNAAVVLASEPHPLAAAVFGEVCATGDLPAGVVNILTGKRSELLGHMASHREIDAIHGATNDPAEVAVLAGGAAENLKRVTLRSDALREEAGTMTAPGKKSKAGSTRQAKVQFSEAAWYQPACESPYWIEPFTEAKTIWHPASM